MTTPKFNTQAEINAEIDRLTARGNAAEVRRDRADFESPIYWKHHDVALKWFTRAQDLIGGENVYWDSGWGRWRTRN